MMIDTYLTAQQIMEQTGLSAAELAALPMDEYARLSGRQTPAEAALAALDAQFQPSIPQAPQQPPAPAQEQPQGLDPSSQEYFLAWRQNRTRGGEGKGIFDSVGSRSDAYAAGVRRHAGRGALSSANVVEPPRLTDRYVRHDDMRDTRPAAERFSNQANAFGI
jgi:hypothetical protein